MVSAPRMTAFALVLVCAACGSVGSPQDQYKARESGREDRLHPAAATLAQATDQTSQTHHHFALSQSQQPKKIHGDKAPDSHLMPKKSNTRRERHKRATRENRFKRNSPWSGTVSSGVYDFSQFRPQTEQISRPYFIPVFVQRPSGITLYGPPQPIHSNPGYPQHNKPGPMYLPPPPSSTEADVGDRVDPDPDIYWDSVDAPVIGSPSSGFNERLPENVNGNSLNNNFNTPTTRRPASRPTRPNVPIERVPGDGSIPPQLLNPNNANSRPSTSTRPKPNTIKSDNTFQLHFPNDNSGRPQTQNMPQSQASQSRPPTQSQVPLSRPQGSQSRTQSQGSQQSRPPQQGFQSSRNDQRITTTAAPSPERSCVWAILSCCVPGNMEVKESCFESRGCSGPFWGNNPCSPIYTQTVLNAAMNYFE